MLCYEMPSYYKYVVFNNGNSGTDSRTGDLEFQGDGYIYMTY